MLRFAIQPLAIDFLTGVWYFILFVLAIFSYTVIFQFFAIDGHKKAAEMLGGPKCELKDAMRRSRYLWSTTKSATDGLGSFLGNKIDIHANHRWIESFFELCHWCGYQVLIRKDSDADIEEKSSNAYNGEILNKIVERDDAYLKDNTINDFQNETILSNFEEEALEAKFRL